MFDLWIRPIGRTCHASVLEVEKDCTVGALKSIIQHSYSIPCDQQSLVTPGGRRLDGDKRPLMSYGIEDQSTIEVHLSLKGGLIGIAAAGAIIGGGLFGKSSASSYLNAVNDVLNTYMFNQMVTVTNQNSSLCQINQTITLVNGPTGTIQCPISLTQTAQNNCQLSAIFNTTQQSNISQVAVNALTQANTQNQTVNQQFLSLASSMQVSSASLQQSINNFLQQNLTTNITNACIANATVNQNSIITNNGKIICPAGTSFNIGQNAQIFLLSNCVATSVVSLLSTQNTVNTANQTATQTQAATQQGLFGALAGFFSSPIVIIIIIIIIIGLVAYFLLRRGGGAAAAQQQTAYQYPRYQYQPPPPMPPYGYAQGPPPPQAQQLYTYPPPPATSNPPPPLQPRPPVLPRMARASVARAPLAAPSLAPVSSLAPIPRAAAPITTV